ncbi:MAG TPA: ABC transporter permease [Terriglobales bacterium]|nr:ABC transporter permease [Terriglobales bacterium]
MNLWEITRQTFATFRAHKLRSFLTMFGVIWGIASVIVLVGLGRGFSKDQQDRMRTLGTDLAVIWGGRTSEQAGGYAAGREVKLDVGDAEAIKAECPRIAAVSPELRRSVSEVSSFNQAARNVRGVWPEYQSFRSINVGEGRLMNEDDEAHAQRVVLLGSEAASQLFPGQPAIGSQLMMNGLPYTVIGVLKKKRQNGSYGSGPDDGQLFVPYSSMARDFPPDRKGAFPGWINNLVVSVRDPDEHEMAIGEVYRVLGARHHFEPTDKDALFIWNTMHGAKLLRRIFDVMTIFFGCVALITLALGGIGVMNIMLVAVTERTREIGVRKALGATQRDILRQFFAESVVLTCFSGFLGFAAGLGFCWLLAVVPKPEFIPVPLVTMQAVVSALLTLGLITMTAGMYPARRAAEMTPVECLRSE